MDELDDTHRGFLAALMSAQIMSQEEAQSMLDKIGIAAAATAQPPEQPPALALGDAVRAINSNLRPLGLKLAEAESLDGALSYAVVDTGKDESCKLATHFSGPELEVFQKIVEAAIQSRAGTVSEMKCVNMRNEIKGGKLSGKEVERLLDRLVAQKWLARGDQAQSSISYDDGEEHGGDEEDGRGAGGITLGVRSMIDLKDYLEGEVEVPSPPLIERVEQNQSVSSNDGWEAGKIRLHFKPGEGGGAILSYVVTISGPGSATFARGTKSPIDMQLPR